MFQELFGHPPYRPALSSSDYVLFRSLQNPLTKIQFTSEQRIKKSLDAGAVLSGWEPQIVSKMGNCYGYVFWITVQINVNTFEKNHTNIHSYRPNIKLRITRKLEENIVESSKKAYK